MSKWVYEGDEDNPDRPKPNGDPNLLMNVDPGMWPTADPSNVNGPNKGFNPMSTFQFNKSASGGGGLPLLPGNPLASSTAGLPAAGTPSIAGAATDAAAAAPAAAAPAAAGASSSSLSLLKYLFPTAAGAIQGFLNQRNQSQANNQRTALTESLVDPYRQNMDQTKDLGRLDMMANANVTPTKLTPAPAYAGMAPGVSGGSSYTPSAALRAAALATQKKIAAGQGAPTMTDPSNYGKTSAIDLSSLGWGS